MTRVPVTRPGWRSTGATHCTHVSGAQVWLEWGKDRWRYWPHDSTPGPNGRRDHVLTDVEVTALTSSFATRDDAMLAAELAVAATETTTTMTDPNTKTPEPEAPFDTEAPTQRTEIVPPAEPEPHPHDEPMLQFFVYKHLREELQQVSAPFAHVAHIIVTELPRNPERTAALRKLLESKDCAVRARIYR